MWDGYECTTCTTDLACGVVAAPDPAAGTCGSSCFCVDTALGLGYFAELGTPGSLVMDATDGNTSTSLLGGGTVHAVSVPFDSPLHNAGELLSSLGGTSTIAAISRFNCQNCGLVAYSGTAGTPFALVPG